MQSTTRESRNNNEEGVQSTPTDPLDKLKNEAKEFLSSTKFRSSFAKIDISSWNQGSDISSLSATGQININNALFGPYNPYNYRKIESSLQIEVDKTIYKGGKGKGELTWFWSYVNDNKGFITFNKATTSSEDKKLVLTGGIYFLERAYNPSQGTIKYKKELKATDNKFLDANNFDKYFPKPYWYTQEGGFDKLWYDNGGFIGGAKDLANICNGNECTDQNKIKSSGSQMEGKGNGGGGYNEKCRYGMLRHGCDYVYSGSGDANGVSALQWYDYMYGNIKNIKLKDYMELIYKGAGKRVK